MSGAAAPAPRPGEPLIEARGVTRILPETVPVTLVEDIDLAIGQGEFVAITGPSGSGKSSLLYLLGLLDTPSAGEVFYEGRPVSEKSAEERAAIRLAGIGFVFQFHFLLEEFTALGNVLIPMRRLGRVRRAKMEARGREILTALGLAEHMLKRPDQLSGGQRQRVAVARALANDPPLILADEPTGSLDSHASEQVFRALARLVEEEGRTVVIVTHDLGLAARTHRRIHVVDGRIVADERQGG